MDGTTETAEELRPYHAVANLFPLLQGEEYEQLKADIKANGLREAIWLHPDGSIIDGRNRHRACLDTGTPLRFRTWDGRGSLVAFVVSLNLHRRHLSSFQRAAIATDILPMLEDEARERMSAGGVARQQGMEKIPHPENGKGPARDQAAAMLNTNGRYVSEAKRLKEEAPAIFEQVRAGKIDRSKAMKALGRQVRAKAKAALPAMLPPAATDRYRLICSDIAGLADQVDAESVDYIITDPPYPREYLPVYEHLARFACHALKPGGSLLVMVGQSYLPEILALMTPFIRYQWTVSHLTPGGQSTQLWERKVNTFWKPVLWFVNGEYVGDWIGDVTSSKPNDNDKRYHHWGQSESGIADLLERFTYPGDVICDPFVGGGTTGVVAIDMNRIFVGADVAQEAIDTTAARLAGVA